jgi:hypothetical protein
MQIDVTITATLRPEILLKTVDSFMHNLLSEQDCKCILNIDPVGWSKPQDIYDICRDYFPKVVLREARTPNFGAAFKWCWEQVSAPWVLHLEDDWELKREIDIHDMVKIILTHNLALLRLPQFKSGEREMKNWNKFFPWNGVYYECPDKIGLGFCGHPSLIRWSFVNNTVHHLNENKNPEKQFHVKTGPIAEEVQKWNFGVYGKPGWGLVIQDLGRKWMVKNGWRKKGSKAFFLEWERAMA